MCLMGVVVWRGSSRIRGRFAKFLVSKEREEEEEEGEGKGKCVTAVMFTRV